MSPKPKPVTTAERPLPVPVYNACYYAFFEGKDRYDSLHSEFNATPSDPLEMLRQFSEYRRETSSLSEMKIVKAQLAEAKEYQPMIILNNDDFVCAFRHYATPPQGDPLELEFEEELLRSEFMHHRAYLYSCHWWSSGVRFTYTDREGAFVSAQTFDTTRDRAICVLNIEKMINIPHDDNLYDLTIPSSLTVSPRRIDPTGELVCDWPLPALDIQDGLLLTYVTDDGAVHWYRNDAPGRDKYIRIAWELLPLSDCSTPYALPNTDTRSIRKSLGIQSRYQAATIVRTRRYSDSITLPLREIPDAHTQLQLLKSVTLQGQPEAITPSTLAMGWDGVAGAEIKPMLLSLTDNNNCTMDIVRFLPSGMFKALRSRVGAAPVPDITHDKFMESVGWVLAYVIFEGCVPFEAEWYSKGIVPDIKVSRMVFIHALQNDTLYRTNPKWSLGRDSDWRRLLANLLLTGSQGPELFRVLDAHLTGSTAIGLPKRLQSVIRNRHCDPLLPYASRPFFADKRERLNAPAGSSQPASSSGPPNAKVPIHDTRDADFADSLFTSKSRALTIPPLAPIANDGGYQIFYETLLEIASGVTPTLVGHAQTVTESSKKESGTYEASCALAINQVLESAADALGIPELNAYRAYSSTEMTMVASGAKEPDRAPDVVIMKKADTENLDKTDTGLLRIPYASVCSIGEVKPSNELHIQKEAIAQLLGHSRQIAFSDDLRISEQGFTLCGGVFRQFYFDAEGVACSEPYDIVKNPLLFVNHILLLSTLFTAKSVWSERSEANVIVDSKTLVGPGNIGNLLFRSSDVVRGRRTTVYKVTDGAFKRVVKGYWPTRAHSEAREVRIYHVIGDTEHPNLQKMIGYSCVRNTADIRRVFGVQAVFPRMHIQMTLDRLGTPLSKAVGTQAEFAGKSVADRKEHVLWLLRGIAGCITGEQYLWDTYGIIHGDISIGNICLGNFGASGFESEPFLTDFGLANERRERWRAPSGTMAFISIGQMQSYMQDGLADVLPNDDAESFVWVHFWLVRTLNDFIEGSTTQFALETEFEVEADKPSAAEFLALKERLSGSGRDAVGLHERLLTPLNAALQCFGGSADLRGLEPDDALPAVAKFAAVFAEQYRLHPESGRID